jgi:hypothetical protein
MTDWLLLNWYLAIPWVLGIGAWLFARQRQMAHPGRLGLVFFLIGSGVVLMIDLTQPG